jgi:cobalt-zinc-cadmium efflux system membrane fusion protein
MSEAETTHVGGGRHAWRAPVIGAVVLLLVSALAFQLGRRSSGIPGSATEVRAENGRSAARTGAPESDPGKHVHGEECAEHGHSAEHAGHAEGDDHAGHAEGDDHAAHEEGVATFNPAALAKAGIEVRTVGPSVQGGHLPVTGTVEPNLQGIVKVTPRVAGKITSLRASIGDRVGAGQVLATMTSTELAAAQSHYRQANARVAAAEANLRRQRQLAGFGEFGQHKVQEARGAYNAAQGDLHEALAEITGARNEVAEAQAALAAARAEVVSAQSDVSSAETAVEQARLQVEVTRSRYQRQEALLKEELTSRQEWEQARADFQKAEADQRAAQAAVRAAGARADAADAKAVKAEAVIATQQARLDQARAKRVAAMERLTIATEALQREEKIYRSGVLASKEVADAEAALRQARIERSGAADAVRLLGGVPGDGNTLVVASPLAGRVTVRTVSVGETVPAEKALFAVLNLDSVWVQLNVYSRDLSSVRVGLPVRVTTEAVPGREFTGRVAYVGDVVDETTRTVKVRCVIPNPGGVLKPEMFVRGRMEMAQRRPSITLPREAVQTLEGKSVVFVSGEHEGEFRAREVRLGDTVDGRVVIASGLSSGERVVTRGAFIVKAQTMKGELGHSHAH